MSTYICSGLRYLDLFVEHSPTLKLTSGVRVQSQIETELETAVIVLFDITELPSQLCPHKTHHINFLDAPTQLQLAKKEK